MDHRPRGRRVAGRQSSSLAVICICRSVARSGMSGRAYERPPRPILTIRFCYVAAREGDVTRRGTGETSRREASPRRGARRLEIEVTATPGRLFGAARYGESREEPRTYTYVEYGIFSLPPFASNFRYTLFQSGSASRYSKFRSLISPSFGVIAPNSRFGLQLSALRSAID